MAVGKTPTCCRHFQTHFLERKYLFSDSNFTDIRSKLQRVSFGSGNGLAPNRQQVITSTNVDQDLHYHMTSLSNNEWRLFYSSRLITCYINDLTDLMINIEYLMIMQCCLYFVNVGNCNFDLHMIFSVRCAEHQLFSWWRHQMEMEAFSALLALWAGYSPVTGEFPSQRPVTRSFDVFFDLCLNKRLSKQSWVWWFETPSRSGCSSTLVQQPLKRYCLPSWIVSVDQWKNIGNLWKLKYMKDTFLSSAGFMLIPIWC